MDVSSLPLLGGLLNNQLDSDWLPGLGVNLQNKDVLAIGYNRVQLADAIEKHNPRSITVLTKWADHGDAQMGDLEIIIGDICSPTVFSDQQFDIVATCSVLEHIDLQAAFANINRILRPDGLFVSVFGPTWSGPYGHHLYVVNPTDPLLNFSMWALPGWMHLLSSPSEIRDFYRKNGYEENVIDEVFYNIYETDIINRNMFEDYTDIANQYFIIKNAHLLYNNCPQDIYQLLRKKFPRYHDFSTYGGYWVAVKQDRNAP